jgi:hypothetical protein
MSALLALAIPALTRGVITPWREPWDFEVCHETSMS